MERRQTVIEEVCNQVWPRPHKVPRNEFPRGQPEIHGVLPRQSTPVMATEVGVEKSQPSKY